MGCCMVLAWNSDQPDNGGKAAFFSCLVLSTELRLSKEVLCAAPGFHHCAREVGLDARGAQVVGVEKAGRAVRVFQELAAVQG